MSDAFELWMVITLVIAIMSFMFIIMNCLDLADGGNSEYLKDAKRNVRMCVYSFFAAPLWPISLAALIMYGLYRLAGQVAVAFK